MTINQVYKLKDGDGWYVLRYPCKIKNEDGEWEDAYVYTKGGITIIKCPELLVESVKEFDKKFTGHYLERGVKFVGICWPHDSESIAKGTGHEPFCDYK